MIRNNINTINQMIAVLDRAEQNLNMLKENDHVINISGAYHKLVFKTNLTRDDSEEIGIYYERMNKIKRYKPFYDQFILSLRIELEEEIDALKNEIKKLVG